VFNPPFSQSDKSVDESVPNFITKRAKFMNSDEGKSDTVNKKRKKKGKSKLKFRRRKRSSKQSNTKDSD
jgi:hypothetical protein